MQLRRNFHLDNRGETAKSLREARARYDKMDNQPGDLDPREDRLTLSSGGEEVKVILDGRTFTERYADSQGRVSIGEYTAPSRLLPLAKSQATEVQKSPSGAVKGSTLEWHSGWETSFHHHDDMRSVDARAFFSSADAAFN